MKVSKQQLHQLIQQKIHAAGMNQHVGDDAGVFLAQAGGVNFLLDKLM